MIESIFKFLTEIAICFSKCWKFSFFLYSFKRAFFSFKFFERLFSFELRKKREWKSDFVIFRTSSQNFSFKTLANFTKKKKSFENFFRFTMLSSNVWFHYDIFFFRFLKRNIFFLFFLSIFKVKSIFQHFFVFLKLVTALDFYYNVIAQQSPQTSHKRKSNRIVIVICERVYRGFVLICKKFDIKECWDFAHFRTHTQLNATKKIKKFAWNAIYLIAATENFFFDHLII